MRLRSEDIGTWSEVGWLVVGWLVEVDVGFQDEEIEKRRGDGRWQHKLTTNVVDEFRCIHKHTCTAVPAKAPCMSPGVEWPSNLTT